MIMNDPKEYPDFPGTEQEFRRGKPYENTPSEDEGPE